MDQPSYSFGAYSSLGADDDPQMLDPGATGTTQVAKPYTNYSFIAVLGMAQRLHIRFLPNTWQVPLGGGGQASINQTLVNAQISLAFKSFKPRPNDPFRDIVQEMAVLGHPIVRKHKHILSLEGICWDIRGDPGGYNTVWPVLVFEMARLGDLYSFSRTERFKSLSMKDRLNLCADIAVAIRDMHVNDIIHGDIKPRNVLIFQENDRYIAKIADFGHARCFQTDNEVVQIPKSEPWNPPEVEDPGPEETFSLSQAKQIDVYSFALLCTWLVFEAGSPVDPLRHIEGQANEFVSFEHAQSKNNLLASYKKDQTDKLIDWARQRARENSAFDDSTSENFSEFVSLTLTFDSFSRCIDFEKLLLLLAPPRVLPNALLAQRNLAPEQEEFELQRSLKDLYSADFRLRRFIMDDLESIARYKEPTFKRISPAKAALQLALCCSLGFGDADDLEHALFQLQKHSLTLTDLKTYSTTRAESTEESPHGNTLFSALEDQGYIETIPLVQYYRQRDLLDEAESQYQRDVDGLKACFGEDHPLYFRLAFRLAEIINGQGRKEEAAQRFAQLVEESSQALGRQHPLTVVNQANLADIYSEQGQLGKAEKLMTRVVELERSIFGESNLHTLKSMNKLALIYRDLKQWAKSEELLLRTIERSLQVYGEDHSLTALSKGYMVSLRIDQGRWDEAEELEKQIQGKLEITLGTEHEFALGRKLSLASIYVYQGRPKDAEQLLLQTIPTCEELLGNNHDLTLKGKEFLAVAYENQGQSAKAAQLRNKTSDVGA